MDLQYAHHVHRETIEHPLVSNLKTASTRYHRSRIPPKAQQKQTIHATASAAQWSLAGFPPSKKVFPCLRV